MSAAARLAKLRHQVVLVESGDRLGGRLHGFEHDGGTWHLDPPTVTLPGVLRDLFRKSGRPMERVVEMTPAPPRRHLFADGAVLDLPFGDRALQHDALLSALGDDEWSDWVDAWPERWDLLRRTWLDQLPTGRSDLDRSARRTLGVRKSVSRLDRDFRDARPAHMVLDPLRLEGQDERTTPSFTAVRHYVERTFGRWQVAGGPSALADVLTVRLAERKVEIALGETAVDVVRDATGQVTSVVTDVRSLEADVVVWCAPIGPFRHRGLPAIPASRTLVRLGPDAVVPSDVWAHGDPPVHVWSSGDDRWTLSHLAGEDPLVALARVGLDLRAHVVDDPVTLRPSDLVQLGHWGWLWRGWSSVDVLPGFAPTGGLHHAGAHAWSGGTIEEIGMQTAAIAAAVGQAPR